MNKVLNIAHRGASSTVTENTMASFKKALEIGCDGIEFDVHLTADDELIIFHDKDLTRMTEGRREDLINDLTLEEVRDVVLTGGHRIPTFDEFMEFLKVEGKKPELQIEIKQQMDERKVVDALLEKLEKWDYLDNIYISSFQPHYLKQVSDRYKSIRTIYLSRECKDYPLVESVLTDISAAGVHFLIQQVEAECVDHFKEKDYLVGAWKLKADEEMMAKAKELRLFRATSDDPFIFQNIIDR